MLHKLGENLEEVVADFAKPGLIKKKCGPNSVGAFLECLIDYASPEPQAVGETIIREEMSHMGDKEADVSERIMRAIRKGKRDVFC